MHRAHEPYWARCAAGTPPAQHSVVSCEVEELGRIRSHFVREAVLWVCELAEHDRLEANHAAEELRRYFQSVLETLPAEERAELSEQIQEVCGRLANSEQLSHT